MAGTAFMCCMPSLAWSQPPLLPLAQKLQRVHQPPQLRLPEVAVLRKAAQLLLVGPRQVLHEAVPCRDHGFSVLRQFKGLEPLAHLATHHFLLLPIHRRQQPPQLLPEATQQPAS